MSDISNGEVLNRAAETVGRNWIGFGLSALVAVALPNFLFGLFSSEPVDFNLFAADYGGVSLPVLLLLSFLFKMTVIGACLGAGETERPDLGEAAILVLKRFLPLIGVAILSWIAILVGLVLLIVPGIILFCMLSVAAPAMLAEGEGVIGSLARSRTLTDGNKGMIFALFFLFNILQSVAGLIVNLVAAALADVPEARFVLAGLLAAAIALAEAAITASLYIELRSAKEGGLTDELVEVFQ